MSEELREKAKAATQGEWQIGRLGDLKMTHVVDFGPPPKSPYMCVYEGKPDTSNMRGISARGVCHSDDGSSEANAAYIAAASPDVILSLLDERDRLLAANEGMRKALEEAGEFVRAHAKRNPVFAKGYEKDVIKQAVAIVAKLDALSTLKEEDAR